MEQHKPAARTTPSTSSTAAESGIKVCVRREIYQILDMRKLTFFKNRFHGGREIRTHDQRPMVLPTTPFVRALVRWATSKRLTNRLPKLSLITGASAKRREESYLQRVKTTSAEKSVNSASINGIGVLIPRVPPFLEVIGRLDVRRASWHYTYQLLSSCLLYTSDAADE